MNAEVAKKHWVVEKTHCSLCGKLLYQDSEDAEYTAKSAPSPQEPYKCPYGHGWHLRTVCKRRGNHGR